MKLLPLDKSLKEIDVYVIVSRISNEFYVWKIKHPNTYQAYKDHVNGNFGRTKDLFERSLQEKQMPRMYLLDTLATTEQKAYRHCLAWTRYFMEQGLTPLSTEYFLQNVSDLLPETEQLYDSIRDKPLDLVLSEENTLVSDYHPRPKTQNKVPKDSITLHVSPEEYDRIYRRSRKKKLSMSRYCREMALAGEIHYLETPSPWEHIREIREAKMILRQVLYAIWRTRNYYPADMENIEKMTAIICEEERKFAQAYRENTIKLRKLLPK